VQGVTVAGKAPDYRRYPDRKSYTLSGDLQATHGSIGDALRNIPSVDVDPRGNISLRGDKAVTILVDGQPSALFSGQSRAQVLQQLPADQFERVEVMTNPSAAFSAEGTGGIINLITRKNRRSPPTASLRASGDTHGRDTLSFTGTDSVGKLNLSGTAAANQFVFLDDSLTTEQLSDPASGDTARVVSTLHSRDVSSFDLGRANGDYALDGNTRLSAGLGYYSFRSRGVFEGAYASSALTGPLAQDYQTAGTDLGDGHVFSVSSNLRRDLGGEDHQFTAAFTFSSNSETNANTQAFDYALPVQPDLFEAFVTADTHSSTDLKLEYHGPLPGAAKLVAGYEFNLERDGSDRTGQLGTDAADATVDQAQSDRFSSSQAVHDLYATYDRSFGRLEVMPGLRLEGVVVDTDQLIAGVTGRSSYFELYPTLHATYKLTSAVQLAASYSRRVSRPPTSELNPFRTEYTPLNFAQGNPDLKPAITDSFEADYEYNGQKFTYEVDGFYKDTHDVVSSITESLGGGALLATYENFGHYREGGADLSASLKVSPKLSLSASGDVAWNAYANPDAAQQQARAGLSSSAKGKVNWDVTPKDFVQLEVYAEGHNVSAQGYTGAYSFVELGWRHKFGDRLTFEATVLDPFNTLREVSFIETPTLSQHTSEYPHLRALQLGFTYAFGGGKAPNSRDFDFGGGGPPH
jgi:outer membrane receptor protein involved in Fe transport